VTGTALPPRHQEWRAGRGWPWRARGSNAGVRGHGRPWCQLHQSGRFQQH
jgi:hypothetical protein